MPLSCQVQPPTRKCTGTESSCRTVHLHGKPSRVLSADPTIEYGMLPALFSLHVGKGEELRTSKEDVTGAQTLYCDCLVGSQPRSFLLAQCGRRTNSHVLVHNQKRYRKSHIVDLFKNVLIVACFNQRRLKNCMHFANHGRGGPELVTGSL